jgi:protein TonB
MFEKMIVSSSSTGERRLARYLIAAFAFYVLIMAAALSLSVVLAHPQLSGNSSSAKLFAVAPAPRFSPPTPVPAGPRQQTETLDYRHVANLHDLLNRSNVTPLMPMRPPHLGEFNFGDGPPVSGGAGVGQGSGIGEGSPNQLPVAPVSTTSPPRPAARPAGDAPRDIRPLRLPSTILQGKAVERKIPEYPSIARQIRLEGQVVVEVVISPDGRVESAHAVSGHPLLVKAAVDAAWGWRFQPTLLNGTPVSVTGVITFAFKL